MRLRQARKIVKRYVGGVAWYDAATFNEALARAVRSRRPLHIDNTRPIMARPEGR